ncbi:MAG: F-type H+-transporting ATPase subunit a [Clostridiales bacterium]|jgi:F-type H+-transporting ATPase subunit a|nr:F-type H+-transporting ATPase subunit a [Clostridiales bacterium]
MFYVMSYLSEFWHAFVEKLIEEIKVGDIGAEISHAIEPKILYRATIGGSNWLISDAVVATWGVMLFIFFLVWYMTRKMEMVPTSKRQQISESIVNILMKLCQSSGMTYDQAEKVVPYVGSIAIFISLTNLVTLLKIPAPSKNPAFPITLALINIVYVIYMSIRLAGIKGFWASLIYPKAALLPFKILDYLIKPVSLSLRLFGNVFGAYILMEFIYIIIPVIIPGIIGLWFDLADGILQGVIFTYLSVTYIGEVLEGAHMAHEAAHS